MQTIQNARGYLKFSNVSLDQLQSFAEDLAQDPRFLSVYIRRVSSDRNQFGIGFVSNVGTATKEDSVRFNDEMKDMSMRKFGIGFVGWDISNEYFSIK